MSIICNFLKHCYLIHFIWNQAVSVFVVAEKVKWLNAHRSSRIVLHASPTAPLLLISVDSQLYCGVRVCSGYWFAFCPTVSLSLLASQAHPGHKGILTFWSGMGSESHNTEFRTQHSDIILCSVLYLRSDGSKWHIAPCRALAFLVHKTLGGFKRGNIWIPCRNP